VRWNQLPTLDVSGWRFIDVAEYLDPWLVFTAERARRHRNPAFPCPAQAQAFLKAQSTRKRVEGPAELRR
jgi:hypothetical protein